MKVMSGEILDAAAGYEPTAGIETMPTNRLKRAAVFCGKLIGLGAIMAGSAAMGMFHEPAETGLGPHDAEIDLTLDSSVTFDMGPIGSIIKPLDGTQGIGAHITVGEVPMRQGGVDVEEYARALASFDSDIAGMKSDVAGQGIRYGLYGGVGALSLYALTGRRRREELADSLARPLPKTALATLTALGIAGSVIAGASTVSEAKAASVAVDTVFNDTPLEGARVTGEFLPQVINTYGREIIDRWQENDAFYDAVIENTRTAYQENYWLRPKEGYPIMAFYTDLHCNVGMARVIGEVARLSNADFIADGGDTTMGGTSYEKFCVQILDGELPDIPRVVAGGNHDSAETESQYRQFGFTPLNGKPIEVAGLRILGDDDVLRSAFGAGIHREGNETADQLNHRLAGSACEDPEGVDILLAHDPDVTEETYARNCAATVLSGHVHHETIAMARLLSEDTTLRIIGDNASGAKKQESTLGPLAEGSQSRIYVVKFNQQTGRAIYYQTVTVYPDTSVILSDAVAIPQNTALTDE